MHFEITRLKDCISKIVFKNCINHLPVKILEIESYFLVIKKLAASLRDRYYRVYITTVLKYATRIQDTRYLVISYFYATPYTVQYTTF